MPARSQDEKCFLNMAGEFLVAAELNRRHILSAVTYGTAKSADVWAFDSCSNRAARVEVKTTGPGSRKWVVGEKPLTAPTNPDVFWVLVMLPEPHPPGVSDDGKRGQHAPRFFVLTSGEIKRVRRAAAEKYIAAFREKHGREFAGPGVATIRVDEVKQFENHWEKLEKRVKRADTC